MQNCLSELSFIENIFSYQFCTTVLLTTILLFCYETQKNQICILAMVCFQENKLDYVYLRGVPLVQKIISFLKSEMALGFQNCPFPSPFFMRVIKYGKLGVRNMKLVRFAKNFNLDSCVYRRLDDISAIGIRWI